MPARLAVPLLLAVAALAAPAASGADTIVLERAASAQPANLATYGGTFAWSERAADGTHRLIVRVGDGAPAAAPVPAFTAPVDPDVGPRAGGGAPVIAYARCAAPRSCDVYRFDPAAGRETKVAAISRRGAAEAAPSTWKGAYVFARTTGSARGTYLYRPGAGTRRLTGAVAIATDLGDTYAAILSGDLRRRTLRAVSWSGRVTRLLGTSTASDGGGERYGPPSLTRYFAYWRSEVTGGDEASSVLRVDVRRRDVSRTVQRSTRTLPAGLDLAVPQTPAGTLYWFAPSVPPPAASPSAALWVSAPALTFG
ncbi:MAG: hypothetical protein MUC84_05160 [Solirubrobacteraceae bacterium]|jgi:hypothetical protein|nr:hypothetical protein [Solirubrobacteraceae bacterium]